MPLGLGSELWSLEKKRLSGGVCSMSEPGLMGVWWSVVCLSVCRSKRYGTDNGTVTRQGG